MTSDTDGGHLEERWPERLHADLKKFLDLWKSKCASDGSPPMRADMGPKEMVRLLHALVILERIKEEDGPARYRYRLAGTSHYDVNGFSELTGKYVDDIYGQKAYDLAYTIYDRIIALGEPHYWQGDNPFSDKYVRFERVLAPLKGNDGEVNMLIGMWVWHTT